MDAAKLLVEALAQLQLDGRGVINRLPNEMLRTILGRVQAHHLIRLRLVDKRWKLVIEDICRDKKCLVIMQRWDKDYLSELWNRLNGHLKLNSDFVELDRFSSLLRLSLSIYDYRVLTFVCQHFSSLQMLTLRTVDYFFTIGMIEHLARLTHLTELRIEGTQIDLSILDVPNLVSLHHIHMFTFVDFVLIADNRIQEDLPPNFDVHHFGRALSIIFPNVEHLMVKSVHYEEIDNLLEGNLNLFVNLRSFNLDLNVLIDRLME